MRRRMTRTLPNGAIFALIICGTVLGIAGTDLILPAIPSLPAALGGTPETAQLVLAAYVFGTMVGLLALGELGARRDPRRLLVWSLTLFALASLAATFSTSLETLIAIRFAQGAFGAGPAVFAPGFINGMFPGDRAPRAFARLYSIESLTPAMAPIAGVWLISVGGWTLSFEILGVLGLIAAGMIWLARASLPVKDEAGAHQTSYWIILTNRAFLRHAISQSFSLGGILVFVFGAPAVLTGPLGLSLTHFAILQVVGIAFFITGANLSNRLARRFGTEEAILGGTALLAGAFAVLLVYALLGGGSFFALLAFSILANLGFGVRGPIGFHQAIVASAGDHSRAAALVISGLLVTSAVGTAIVAPFITVGLWPVVLGGAVITALAVAALFVLRDQR
jgi:predicted MFS family arabinose efflux permease